MYAPPNALDPQLIQVTFRVFSQELLVMQIGLVNSVILYVFFDTLLVFERLFDDVC